MSIGSFTTLPLQGFLPDNHLAEGDVVSSRSADTRMWEKTCIPQHSFYPRDSILLTPFSGVIPDDDVVSRAAVGGRRALIAVCRISVPWWQRKRGGSGDDGGDGRWGWEGALVRRAAPPGDRWRRGRALKSATECFYSMDSEFPTLI